MRDRGMVARVLAIVAGAVSEASLVRLAQQWIERLVLASAEHDARQAERNHLFESLDRVGSLGRCFQIFWCRRPKVSHSLDGTAALEDFDREGNVRD